MKGSIIMGKLVRDKIPEIIKSSGSIPRYKIISSDIEFSSLLKIKLLEEVNEYIQSGSLPEICDILEVLFSLIEISDYSLSEIEALRVLKAQTNGTFQKRVYLISVDNHSLEMRQE